MIIGNVLSAIDYTYSNNEITFSIIDQPVTLTFQPSDNTMYWRNSQLVRQPFGQPTNQPTSQPTTSGPFRRVNIPTNPNQAPHVGIWDSSSMKLELGQGDKKAVDVTFLPNNEKFVSNIEGIQYHSNVGISDILITIPNKPNITFKYFHQLDAIVVNLDSKNTSKNIVLSRKS